MLPQVPLEPSAHPLSEPEMKYRFPAKQKFVGQSLFGRSLIGTFNIA